jgi:tetratricopeptide (TPR) repeat protein
LRFSLLLAISVTTFLSLNNVTHAEIQIKSTLTCSALSNSWVQRGPFTSELPFALTGNILKGERKPGNQRPGEESYVGVISSNKLIKVTGHGAFFDGSKPRWHYRFSGSINNESLTSIKGSLETNLGEHRDCSITFLLPPAQWTAVLAPSPPDQPKAQAASALQTSVSAPSESTSSDNQAKKDIPDSASPVPHQLVAQGPSSKSSAQAVSRLLDHRTQQDAKTSTPGASSTETTVPSSPASSDKQVQASGVLEIYDYSCKVKGKTYPLRVDADARVLNWRGKQYSLTDADCGRAGWHAVGNGTSFDFCTATKGYAAIQKGGKVEVECDLNRDLSIPSEDVEKSASAPRPNPNQDYQRSGVKPATDHMADEQTICSSADGELARDACTRLISSHSLASADESMAYFARGRTNLKLGAIDAAIDDFTSAVALRPTFANAYSERADLRMIQGKYDLAISDYTKALEIDIERDKAGHYKSRAVAYDKLGDVEHAKADLKLADGSVPYRSPVERKVTSLLAGTEPKASDPIADALRRGTGAKTTTASPSPNGATPPEKASAFEVPSDRVGSLGTFIKATCQMQDCLWTSLKSRLVIAKSENGVLIGAQLEGCVLKQGRPLRNNRCTTQVSTSDEAAFCSTRFPSIASKDEKGQWSYLNLSISDMGLYGYNRESISDYLRVCHGYIFGADNSTSLDLIGAKFGYSDRYDQLGDHESGTLNSVRDLIK